MGRHGASNRDRNIIHQSQLDMPPKRAARVLAGKWLTCVFACQRRLTGGTVLERARLLKNCPTIEDFGRTERSATYRFFHHLRLGLSALGQRLRQ